jgi:LmbE family N-acetylglucosaminyl deacetylase
MNLGKTLIVAAHLDDIEVGMGGYLSTLTEKQTDLICTYTACSGLHKIDEDRKNVFLENMNTLNIKTNLIDNYLDTTLTLDDITFIKKEISNIIAKYDIKTIFVVNNDTHNDHALIYDAVSICARQTRTKVDRMYAYQVYTNFDFKDFNCTMPFYSNLKYELIEKYEENINTIAIEGQDLVFGASIQELFAEKVKVIFDTI